MSVVLLLVLVPADAGVILPSPCNTWKFEISTHAVQCVGCGCHKHVGREPRWSAIEAITTKSHTLHVYVRHAYAHCAENSHRLLLAADMRIAALVTTNGTGYPNETEPVHGAVQRRKFARPDACATRACAQASLHGCGLHCRQDTDQRKRSEQLRCTAGAGWSSRGSRVCVTMPALQCQC